MSYLPILLIIEAILGFVVFSADTAEAEGASLQGRLLGATLWPVTLASWFSNQAEQSKRLRRLAVNVWFLVTTGWLISFEYDHLQGQSWRLLLVLATPAFVVYCIDAMAVSLYKKPGRRTLRVLLWPKALAEYLCDSDSIRTVHSSVLVWILLTLCWLVGILIERFGPR